MYGTVDLDLNQEMPNKGLDGVTCTIRLIDWLPAETYSTIMQRQDSKAAMIKRQQDGLATPAETFEASMQDMEQFLPDIVLAWNIKFDDGTPAPLPSEMKADQEIVKIRKIPMQILKFIFERAMLDAAAAAQAAGLTPDPDDVKDDSGLPLENDGQFNGSSLTPTPITSQAV